MALSLVCIGWSLWYFGEFPEDQWFIILECVVSGMVLMEVIWKGILQGSVFFKMWGNWFDLMVSMLCIMVIFTALVIPNLAQDVEGISGQLVLVLRNLIQYLRLVVSVKNQRESQQAIMQMIDFSELAEQPEDNQKQTQNMAKEVVHTATVLNEVDKSNNRLDLSEDMP